MHSGHAPVKNNHAKAKPTLNKLESFQNRLPCLGQRLTSPCRSESIPACRGGRRKTLVAKHSSHTHTAHTRSLPHSHGSHTLPLARLSSNPFVISSSFSPTLSFSAAHVQISPPPLSLSLCHHSAAAAAAAAVVVVVAPGLPSSGATPTPSSGAGPRRPASGWPCLRSSGTLRHWPCWGRWCGEAAAGGPAGPDPAAAVAAAARERPRPRTRPWGRTEQRVIAGQLQITGSTMTTRITRRTQEPSPDSRQSTGITTDGWDTVNTVDTRARP